MISLSGNFFFFKSFGRSIIVIIIIIIVIKNNDFQNVKEQPYINLNIKSSI